MLLVEVSKAAKSLGVSPRRVRALLAQGRLIGYKNQRKVWMVMYPLEVIPGKRGPDLHKFPIRHIYAPPTPRTVGGKGSASPDAKKRLKTS
ncbi:helix-turn-helix domain-containing protein [Pseudomethylobacillus aquaticus]|nr:helix-turn-helix domain-containing protein [Pseudomethylobacillus aquaticus]